MVRLTAKDVVLLYLRRRRSASPRESFESTHLGIATATGVPYPRVSEALKAHEHDGFVEVRRDHVREFAGEGKMRTFHLTPSGWAETERLLNQLAEERITLQDGTDPARSISGAEAVRNPPVWLPHRLGDLTAELSDHRTMTPESLEEYRGFLALRIDLIRELHRSHSRDRTPVIEQSALVERLQRPPSNVEAALRSLAQEMAVELKPVKSPEGTADAWVRLKSAPYARFALRGEDLAAPYPPSAEAIPDSSGLCLAARQWLMTAEKLRIEDLLARPLETGAHARIMVTHVPSRSRFEVTFTDDGRVLTYRTA